MFRARAGAAESTQNAPLGGRKEAQPSGGHTRLITAALLTLLALGLVVRLNGLDRQPLEFHPTRQYRSALIARAFYLDRVLPQHDRRRVVADQAANAQGVLEPPVMEEVTSFGYQLIGDEHLWLARLLSSVVWLCGGLLLFRLLRRFVTPLGQLVGVAVFVLVPLGVEGGRSFQPDGLMVVLILATFLALARYGESPTKYRLVVAALAAGAAMLVKAVAAPMVLLVCVTYQLVTRGRRGLLSREWAWFVVIAGLPVALFYGDGLFVSGFLRGQAASNFIPHLLVEPAFWHNWTTIISVTIGWGLVLLAGIGTMLLPRPWRAVVAAMWAGYFVFGLTNDYRTATHTYYHLQLVPVVAIGVAGLISAGQRRLSRYPDWRLLRLGAAFTGVLALVLLVRAAFAITPAVPPAQRALPGIDQRIGSLTGHSARVLSVTTDYGTELAYYGQVAANEYPSPDDVALARLQGQHPPSIRELFNPRSGRRPQWLAVTNWHEWTSNAALRSYVSSHDRLAASGPDWALYDLRPH
jgi:hypothetical protein